MYLFAKCSYQPARGMSVCNGRYMIDQTYPSCFLYGKNMVSSVLLRKRSTYISSEVRSSSLSRGWSVGVSISVRASIQCCPSQAIRSHAPMSNDCFAIPRDASLPAKFPYMPSIRVSSASCQTARYTHWARRSSSPLSHRTPYRRSPAVCVPRPNR